MVEKIISLSKTYQLICLTNVLKGVISFSPKERKEGSKYGIIWF